MLWDKKDDKIYDKNSFLLKQNNLVSSNNQNICNNSKNVFL